MKPLGLIGGMSWESTAEYYRLLNQGVAARLGGLHSAHCLLYSVDFQQIETWQREGAWERAGQYLAEAAQALAQAGAEGLLLCTNTMHKVADAITAAVDLPLIHIADPTAEAIQAGGLKTIGLLGTRFTMEEDFYIARLRDDFGLNVLIPDAPARQLVDRIIFEELCLGVVTDESRRAYQTVMDGLVSMGAEGIILGCTEIMLLIQPEDCPVPSFDTTALHVAAALDFMLG